MSIQGNTVRTLSLVKDWTYGNNLSGYLTGNAALAQQINCRILQLLGECFWDTGAGINWYGYLGGKNSLGLNLAIRTVILNTLGGGYVTAINSVSLQINSVARTFTVSWNISTIYSKSFPGTSTLSLVA